MVAVDPLDLYMAFSSASIRLYLVSKKRTKKQVNRVNSPAITNMDTEGEKTVHGDSISQTAQAYTGV